MYRVLFRTPAVLLIAVTAFLSTVGMPKKTSSAAVDEPIHFRGTIRNNGVMTGIFGPNSDDVRNVNWFVFIGLNDRVYKLGFTNREVSYLYIDGKRVDDNMIGSHATEFRSHCDKFWRERDIEAASAELDHDIQQISRKVEAIARQIEKADRSHEKYDREGNVSTQQQATVEERQGLAQIERKLNAEIEGLAARQETLAREQKSLGLMDETDKVLNRIREDLRSLGVLKGKSDAAFKLSTVELIANGRQASPDIYELMKSRYLPESGGETGFMYNWKTR